MDPDPATGPPTTTPGSPDSLLLGRQPRPGPSRPTTFRARLIGGLVFALPIAITFSIVYWLLSTLQLFILDPIARLTAALFRRYPGFENLPGWWVGVASPLLALVLGVVTLYFLGLALRSWIYRWIDWLLLHVPIVNTIYRAVRNVVESLGSQFQGGSGFKRVVLVEFPHPGMRSLGLVTNSLQDATTGRPILCVVVMTGVMPPTGFTLFVPEEAVTNIAWNVNETLQAILSGGITTPPTIHYTEGLRTPLPAGGGPIVDSRGHVLGTADGMKEA